MSVLIALITTAAAILSDQQRENEHDRLAHRLGVEYDPELPFRIGPVVFDPEHGIGNVSINSNVNYLGFVVWMRPSEYLALNPPLEDEDSSYAWILEQVKSGHPIAPPWLDVRITPDAQQHYEADHGPRDEGGPTSLKVIGHEGRHRMMVIRALCGDDVLVPVPVFMPSWRARHLSPHMLLGAVMQRDREAEPGPGLTIERLTFNRQNHVADLAAFGPPLSAHRSPLTALHAHYEVPTIELSELYHMGSMDPKNKGKRGQSFEGHTLSVTDGDHIDDWRRIAKLGGEPLWLLSKPDGLFLDRRAIDDAVISAWGVENGFIEPATVYVVSWYDGVDDEQMEMTFLYDDEAAEEIEYNEGATVEEREGWFPKRSLQNKIRQHVEPSSALDMVSLLYADWLGLDGVWWQDDEGEMSAPRGGILPGRLELWRKERIG